MRRPSVHQVVIGAGSGDAITAMAIALRDALRSTYTSEIYAHHLAPEMRHQVLPIEQAPIGSRRDVIVYHASFGIPHVTRWLLARRERIVIVYHNITPWDLFIDVDPEFASGLYWGRHELELLKPRVILALADSAFNRADLETLGYRGVEIVPAGLVPDRLRQVRPHPATADRLREHLPEGFVLTVSQVLPHKRMELVIQAMHLVQWVHGRRLGLVIAGHHRLPAYARALHQMARQLNVRDLWISGALSDSELATCYRAASLFVSASAHEGLALPPLEAMSFGLPVIALGAGAIPDTVGEGGLVLPADAGPVLLAEAMVEVSDNEALRGRLRSNGHARVRAIAEENPTDRSVHLIRRAVGE